MGNYRDKDNNIKDGLLDSEAKKIAESFIKFDPDRNNPKIIRPKAEAVTSAQLRKFFNEFRSLEKKVHFHDFNSVKPLIMLVKSKAYYAANPSNPKIKEKFKNFLVTNIDKIETKQDFEDFMLYFEAVVGFFYGFGVKND